MIIMLHQAAVLFTVVTLIVFLAFTVIFFVLAFRFAFADLPSHREREPRPLREPARWSPPGVAFGWTAAQRQLDEAMVYKELANYVNRMYHDGRISLKVRDRVLRELEEKLKRIEGDQGDSKASS